MLTIAARFETTLKKLLSFNPHIGDSDVVLPGETATAQGGGGGLRGEFNQRGILSCLRTCIHLWRLQHAESK
jgi:hypothetical protein